MAALLDTVLYEALPYGFLGLALVLTFRYLRLIDLTFAATFAGAPAVAGALIVQGAPFGVALCGAAVFTLAAAFLTIAMMRILELDGLLAGLLTSLAGFSVALMFTQGTLSLHGAATPLTPLQTLDFNWLAEGVPLHPAQVAFFAVLLAAATLAVDRFLQSEMGLAFRAMEDEKSRSSLLASIGVSEWRMRTIGIVGGNLLCAASGILVMLKEGQVTASRGFDALVTIIAAYLFGTILFERRYVRRAKGRSRFSILSKMAFMGPSIATIFGIIFYFLLLAIVLRLDLPSSTPKLLLVLLVLIAFALTRWSEIRFRFKHRRGPRIYPAPEGIGFSAQNVTVSYPGISGPITILREVAFNLKSGALIQLTGRNGSGKSTLLKYLAGQIPGEGSIAFSGGNEGPAAARQAVGYISQDSETASSGSLTVAENLSLYAVGDRPSPWKRWTAPSSAALPPAIRELADTAWEMPARALSGGQRQAVAISAMVLRPHAPSVILFDEPLTHLDEANALACVELIEMLASRGHTMVIVQHDIDPTAVEAISPARRRLGAHLTETRSLAQLQDWAGAARP